jgi:hypothetical protein
MHLTLTQWKYVTTQLYEKNKDILLIGYSPEAHTLARGWKYFMLRDEEDCRILLTKEWTWGPFGLILNPWTVDFDPVREPVALMCV